MRATLSTRKRRAFLDALLDEIVPPPPTERYFGDDLTRMSRSALLRERGRIRLRLLLDDDPHPWLLQRFALIEEMLGYGTG